MTSLEFLSQWLSGSDHVIAHTSGSTGAPKEIHLLRSDMRASARATVSFFNLGKDSLLGLPLSPDYIAGKMQIVRTMECGGAIKFEEPSSSPFAQGDDVFDLLPVVPSQVPGLLASGAIARVRNLIVGGAPLSPELEAQLVATGVNAYATYGMTETCSHVALRRLGSPNFIALPGFTFSTDPRGCLVITSSTLSFGQLITNDMVSLESPQTFRWLGRWDNVINSGGVKIHPEEIEKVLQPLLPEGATAYVTSRPSSRWGEEAIIVTDSPEIGPEILAQLHDVLPGKLVPKGVVNVDAIERTSSGKIMRRKW